MDKKIMIDKKDIDILFQHYDVIRTNDIFSYDVRISAINVLGKNIGIILANELDIDDLEKRIKETFQQFDFSILFYDDIFDDLYFFYGVIDNNGKKSEDYNSLLGIPFYYPKYTKNGYIGKTAYDSYRVVEGAIEEILKKIGIGFIEEDELNTSNYTLEYMRLLVMERFNGSRMKKKVFEDIMEEIDSLEVDLFEASYERIEEIEEEKDVLAPRNAKQSALRKSEELVSLFKEYMN